MRDLTDRTETDLAAVIRRLGGRGFESAFDAWLCRCVPFDNLILLAYRDAGLPQVLYRRSARPQVFARLESVYLAGAYLLDPFHDLHVRRAPAGLYRMRDIAPDRFQSSRYYRDYYERTTILDEFTYVAYPAEGVSVNLCLGRDAGSGTLFSPREAETLARLTPVILALAETHWATLRPEPGSDAEDLPHALREALADARGIRLSPRQAEVALLILRGHSSVSIALRLGVSAQTVKVFRRQLHDRCGISTQAELFALLMPLLRPASG